MTVPEERTEAVLRTRQFLLELADAKVTPRIPLRVRQRAISLLKHLPTGGDLAFAAKTRPDIFGVPGKSWDMTGTGRSDDAGSIERPAMNLDTTSPADLKSSHITAVDGNVFEDLGFSGQEAKALLEDADARRSASSLEQVMKVDLEALAKVLVPMTDNEIQALSALEWLERKVDLPHSIKAYFWGMLERATDAVLPEAEKSPLRGCADVRLYRDALNLHFARRRA